jgi:hypothetical protein
MTPVTTAGGWTPRHSRFSAPARAQRRWRRSGLGGGGGAAGAPPRRQDLGRGDRGGEGDVRDLATDGAVPVALSAVGCRDDAERPIRVAVDVWPGGRPARGDARGAGPGCGVKMSRPRRAPQGGGRVRRRVSPAGRPAGSGVGRSWGMVRTGGVPGAMRLARTSAPGRSDSGCAEDGGGKSLAPGGRNSAADPVCRG